MVVEGIDLWKEWKWKKEEIVVVCAKKCVKHLFGERKPIINLSKIDMSAIKPNSVPYRIIKDLCGVDLIDIKYDQILKYVRPIDAPERAFRVVDADFVTTKEGTGIVHLAPTFGEDDFNVAKQKQLPLMLVKDEEQEGRRF